MLSRDQFSLLREGAFVVNVSRGGLVDEEALREAIDAGRLSGAALDVLEHEPPTTGHPLATHPNVMVTPHMAWYSVQAQTTMRERASQEVARFLRGEPLHNPLIERMVL
jgi:D-3-phosphoglycerate dehydrogenase